MDAPSGGQLKLICLRVCAFKPTVKTDLSAWMRLQADSKNWSACVDAPSGGQRKLISLRICAFSWHRKLISLRRCAFSRTAKTDQPSWMRLQAENEDSDQFAWMCLQADSENWLACVDAPWSDSENWLVCVDASSDVQGRLWSVCV